MTRQLCGGEGCRGARVGMQTQGASRCRDPATEGILLLLGVLCGTCVNCKEITQFSSTLSSKQQASFLFHPTKVSPPSFIEKGVKALKTFNELNNCFQVTLGSVLV